MQRKTSIVISILLLVLCSSIDGHCTTFINFDNIPETEQSEMPSNATDGSWLFSAPSVNSNDWITLYDGSGWYSTTTYDGGGQTGLYNFIRTFKAEGNNAHMGYETYGYLEISPDGVIDKCLSFKVTGGQNSEGEHGTALFAKDVYLEKVTNNETVDSQDGVKVGHPYLYFQNTSLNDTPIAFPEAANSNRLSMYIWTPEEVVNDPVGASYNPPQKTMSIGPYNNMGGHWYHAVYTQGGGWTKVLLDGHPRHNNAYSSAANYPYPSSSLRDMGVDYFDTMYRWYVTFWPYSGIATPGYEVKFDEIVFYNDSEPQNNETINSPSIVYNTTSHLFQVGFSDKYTNNADSWSTYEVRYSFSQITNANWNSATPVFIQTDTRFTKVLYNEQGIIKKQWPYYQAVWAPFKLKTEDQSLLTPGKVIYFAIKDISQSESDSLDPRAYREGRNYRDNAGTYDYAGDLPVLDLIKRIDYRISASTIPTITITTPNGQNAPNASFIISGTASAVTGRTISSVTSPGLTVTGTTNWSTTVVLSEETREYTFTADDSTGETAQASITVTYKPPPTVTITTPDNQTVENQTFPISGTSSAASDLTVSSVKSSPELTVTGTTDWSTTAELSLGDNSFTFTVEDSLGKTTEGTITVTYDPNPEIGLNTPTNHTVFDPTFSISGTASAAPGRTISSVTSPVLAVTGTTNWSATATLSEGVNDFTFTVEDSGGKTAETSITVTYDVVVTPDPDPDPDITITTTKNQIVQDPVFYIFGTSSAAPGRSVSSVTSPGLSVSGTTNWSTTAMLSEGVNKYTFTVEDSTGNTAEDTITVIYKVPGAGAPKIAITTTNNQIISNATFTISGTASASSGRTIASVTSPGLTVTGTSNWSAIVTLSKGVNNYTFTVEDSTGETAQASITITYNIPNPTDPTNSNSHQIDITAVESQSGCFVSSSSDK